MAYKVEYNGLRFLNNPNNIEVGGSLVLKEFSFFEVATSSSTEKYAIRHGEYVSPTMVKNRRIRILFDIIANSEEERRVLLKKVQKAFTPEINPTPFNKKLRKNLSFLDVDCEEWNCKCQVLQGIQLSDFANQKRAGVSVELITDSPYFVSNKEYLITTRNTLSGIKLPTKFPFKWQYYKGVANYSGIINSPLNIEMEILDTNTNYYPYNKIKVISQGENNNGVLYVENIGNLGLVAGNKIIIDAGERRCYLQNDDGKEDITGFVAIGSERPSLEVGKNIIAIDTGVWNECIEAKIKWNDLF